MDPEFQMNRSIKEIKNKVQKINTLPLNENQDEQIGIKLETPTLSEKRQTLENVNQFLQTLGDGKFNEEMKYHQVFDTS